MKSIFLNQISILLWKNFRLRKRRPFQLAVEILIPLLIIFILIGVRSAKLTSNTSQCLLKEKQTASMGPIPFIRDFLCTFNTTCYNQSQIDWQTDYTRNDFRLFVKNISEIYDSLSQITIDLTTLITWFSKNPDKVTQLKYSFTYLNNVMSPLIRALNKVLSDNRTDQSDGKMQLGSAFCGSDNNDLLILLNNITFSSNSRPKRSISECRMRLKELLGQNSYTIKLYAILAPLIFGKIYYSPDTNFTRKIIEKANMTFKILDDLRLSAVEWRLNYKVWFVDYMNDSAVINTFRSLCARVNLQFCQVFNMTNVESFAEIASLLFGVIERALNCTVLDKFAPLNSSSEIDGLTNKFWTNIFAALDFNDRFRWMTEENTTLLEYAIRMPTNRIDSTKNFKVLDQFYTLAPRRNTFSDLKYYTSGFLFIQQAVDEAFTQLVTGKEGHDWVGSSMQIMPYPCFVDDKFVRFLANMMPFLLIIAWSTTVVHLIKNIVYEKENRLKEFMRVMGLTNLVHWLSWFISVVAVLIVPIFITALMLKFAKILPFSNPGVVFLVLLFYVISLICQSFLISVFFNKANIAAVTGGIIYFLCYMPFLVFIKLQDDITLSVYYIGGLLSQVAFSNAINFIAYWEQSTDGANFSNLFEGSIFNLNFGVGHCLIMMLIDCVIYLLITWYVEAVFPGEFGVPKSWYFPFQRSYWCVQVKNSGYNEINPEDDLKTIQANKNNNEQNLFETEPYHLKIGISIKNLMKLYKNSKVAAVNDLNLNFYESQITAFLGHNGAGKTTTISILTGIISPTSGTAFILNDDIRTDIDKIRHHVGLCPQHNILFGDLTVEDHIYFYGLLKGMKKEEIKEKLPKIVQDVGLTKKSNTASKKLSGGMKRKLSVAMAFVGDSRIVFLDEPTAGVDPFARRGIWDLLIKYRSDDRTIILTTHHMDEADYLSDRIAIISQGKLKCCGSSVFLKKIFGDGYYLILVKADSIQEEIINDEITPSGEKVLNFVRSFVPDAKMIEETRTQWSIVLPQNDINSVKFSALFERLDQSIDHLNIVTYGLSDTSLEEVFLKVAEDPSDSVPENSQPQKLTGDNLDLLTDNGILPRPSSILSLKHKSNSRSDRLCGSQFNLFDTTRPYFITGYRLLLQQITALQIKRFHHNKRNIKAFFAELILPVLMILLIVILLQLVKPFDNQPPMVISPWLMMPKTRPGHLQTFYRKENISDELIDQLVLGYRSDLGESGVRCMNPSIYKLEPYKCHWKSRGDKWSAIPQGEIPQQTAKCDCNKTGYQICSNPSSGGPQYSSRLMASTDIVGNLTGYNLTDHLLKRYKSYARKQYGGFQFLLPSNFGQSMKSIGESSIWGGLEYAAGNKSQKFVTYFQQFFIFSGFKTNFTRVWVNTKGYVSMPAYSNMFSNLLLRSQLNSSKQSKDYGIVVTNFPFKYSQDDLMNQMLKEMFLEVSLAVFIIFSLSFIPASFIIFLIEERITGSKRQQFVSGINPYVYWISNFLWDISKYVLPVFIVILIFVAFNYQAYIGSKNIAAFITLLIFYGFAIIPHMYPFSFVLSTPSTAFVILEAYNLLVGAVTTVSTFFLDLLQQDDESLEQVNKVLKKVFLIFPQYDLGRGMMDLSISYLKYNMSLGDEKYNQFDWNVTGEKLLSMMILCLCWWIILCVIESGLINRVLCGKLKNYKLKFNEMIYEEDSDIKAERNRINTELNVDDVLKVVNLTKIYNPSLNMKCRCFRKALKETLSTEKRKLAVNNICFGVKEGECFGLLGVNGAGKTTTFKMLTGEEDITRGNAFINKYSIIDDMISAHKNMGFCPQFDALHALLTCEEQLYFYCRIRGIEKSQIASTVEASLKNLSLIPHAKKQTQALSGGNKRKLSTAIALIGCPKVIFLDEPTSGMDAGARRFLWNIIQRMTNENKIAVILTSHNMEECEVLCHRLSIMVNGEMKCIGSVQHLKSKFGDDYYVVVRLHSERNQNDNRKIIKELISKKFGENVSLKDENFVTLQYRFVPSFKLSMIFDFFENLKQKNIILDYSVSQTTLDDVFINFAKADLTAVQSPQLMTNNSMVSYAGHFNDSFDSTSMDSGANSDEKVYA